ncbi:UNVERIFIED_CONTAM: hypothetical protein FKN15_030550 [Acipenser sinensis]
MMLLTIIPGIASPLNQKEDILELGEPHKHSSKPVIYACASVNNTCVRIVTHEDTATHTHALDFGGQSLSLLIATVLL